MLVFMMMMQFDVSEQFIRPRHTVEASQTTRGIGILVNVKANREPLTPKRLLLWNPMPRSVLLKCIEVERCAEKPKLLVQNLNLKGLGALDLRTLKPDGTAWNFCNRKDRQEARLFIDKSDPDWIVGSPPCTAFALWNRALN